MDVTVSYIGFYQNILVLFRNPLISTTQVWSNIRVRKVQWIIKLYPIQWPAERNATEQTAGHDEARQWKTDMFSVFLSRIEKRDRKLAFILLHVKSKIYTRLHLVNKCPLKSPLCWSGYSKPTEGPKRAFSNQQINQGQTILLEMSVEN